MRASYLPAILLVTLACSASTSGQPAPSSEGVAPSLAIQEGDTVIILMHKVKAEHRADYERFMNDKWAPAAKKLASQNAAFGEAFRRRWRLVPLGAGDDSLLTYVFVYPAFRGDAPGGTWAIYRAGGASDEQVAQDSTAWM
jgi:hypothetical protein